jgi:hypothetical protein
MRTEEDVQRVGGDNQQRRINLQRWRTILNLVLLFIIFRDSHIIRSDGPSGFGEMALKGIIFLLSLIFLVANFASNNNASNGEKPRLGLSTGDIVTTLWLAFFATIAMVDACSEGKGYCRHWSLFFS